MTRSEIAVRPMTAADLPEVLAIERRCFPDPWPESVFRSALADGLSLWLAAEAEGKLAGYAGMQSVLDEGYVDNVAVDPAYRRRGAASALLRAFAEEAKKRGLRFLSLEVRAGNAGAVSLYEAHGFGIVGRRKGYYLRPPEDALIMTKFFAEEAER
ncbi:MAG: ribosomal protein S18-alanine N-acetyltransferase [Oscillospiraceae bacterium]|nr:ribosomal protein S18-alanine N-acetyltransferase [Oscillospiraceae bacterium]MBR4691352.1 ribosomal protein S18-alanine N-acetyltransferase [Oscillospiraceae bacterium]